MSQPVDSQSVAQDQLRAFIERIERLDDELDALNDDKKEIFAEAKGNGFDTKAMKIVLRIRRMDHAERLEQGAIVDLYLHALGMVPAPVDDDNEPVRAPAPAHAREIIEEFDAETGEILDDDIHQSQPAVPQSASTAPDRRAGEKTVAIPTGSHDAVDRRVAGPDVADDCRHEPDAVASVSGTIPPRPTAGVNEMVGGVASACSAIVMRRELDENAIANGVTDRRDGQSFRPETATEPGTEASAAALTAEDASPQVGGPAGTIYETTHPRPVRRHPINACWPEHFAMSRARLSDPIRQEGVRKPIVMIGDQILDGWGRYNIARELLIEFPVVQYEGTDPLADSVRWNLDGSGRMMTTNEYKIVATKLSKLPGYQDRASEIAEMFGLEVVA